MVGLRQTAEADLAFILEEDAAGFRWPIVITDPDGNVNTDILYGFSDDIAQIIDPDTGQAVSGRLASIAVRIAGLAAVGLGLPKGIADAGLKPWIVQFDDINGQPHKFKVAQSNPDRALGLVVCLLEAYA